MTVSEVEPLLPKHHEPVNDGQTEEEGSKLSTRRIFSIVVALLGVVLANADDSFVYATYETIASEYKRLSDAPFLLTAYNLGYCVALPVYANASDSTGGRKNPLLFAYVLFTVGCIISGLGVSIIQVIVGRVVAGFGGAGMIAMVSIIVTDIVPVNKVAMLRGYVNVMGIVGRGVGGPLGGFLADTIGWKWSFLGQAPISLACCFLGMWLLPSGSSKGAKCGPSSTGTSKPRSGLRDVDFVGVAVFGAMTTSFLLLLNFGGDKLPWDHPLTITLGVSCGVLAVGFVFFEGLLARKPLIPLRLLTVNGIGIYGLVAVLTALARSATMANMAPYFVRTQDSSNATAANYLLLPAVGYAVGALQAGHIISRTYKYKRLAILAIVIQAAGFFLVAVRWREGISPWEASYAVAAGFGFGMVLSAQFIGLSASAPRPQLATAIGLYYLCQQFGDIMGVGLAAALVRAQFSRALRKTLGDGVAAQDIISKLLKDARYATRLPHEVQEIIRSSYLHAFQYGPFLSTVTSLLALGFIIYLKERPLR